MKRLFLFLIFVVIVTALFIAMNVWLCGDEAVWVNLLALAQDPARRPVLVHCAQGELRTGFFCAVYRMVIDVWSRDKAVVENSKKTGGI